MHANLDGARFKADCGSSDLAGDTEASEVFSCVQEFRQGIWSGIAYRQLKAA